MKQRVLLVEDDERLGAQIVGHLSDGGFDPTWILEERSGGAAFSLRVIDDGPGVPDADVARLCERSFRGDAARSRHPSGLGLGLHVARDVATRHEFEMMLRRSEHGGLEVEFAGPTARAPDATGA